MTTTTKFIALLSAGFFVGISPAFAATITDVSNIDGGTGTGGAVVGIDLNSSGEEFDSAASGATAVGTVNANLDYVVSNWGASSWDGGSNLLQNVGGLLDITISENLGGGRQYDPSTASNRSSTGTSSIVTDFIDNRQITIDFSLAVDTAGFVITNLGAAYDNSDGGILTATFHTGVDGTGTTISTQTWSDGGNTDTNAGDGGAKDAYFGLSGAGSFRSIVLDVQRDGNTGNGGTGLDDLGFAVVPEPSTFVLFGLAGVAVVLGLRRRR